MKKFLFLAFLSLAQINYAADGGELLYWMVMSTDSITGTAADGTVFTAAELGVTGARVRYEGDDGSYAYLPIIGVHQNGMNNAFEGSAGVAVPGGYYASLGNFTGDAYRFVLELGNWSNGAWTGTSMESVAVDYDTLKNNLHIANWDGINPSYARPWTPTDFFVVPEPSGGLLILLGGALLALRRRVNRVV